MPVHATPSTSRASQAVALGVRAGHSQMAGSARPRVAPTWRYWLPAIRFTFPLIAPMVDAAAVVPWPLLALDCSRLPMLMPKPPPLIDKA